MSLPSRKSPPEAAPAIEELELGGFRVRLDARFRPAGSPAEVGRSLEHLLDPAAATKTLHWGRNYIYLACLGSAGGPLPVAVKQFPAGGLRQRLRRRLSGTKAAKSFRVAREILAAGLLTPEPVLVAESRRPEGASYYVCRFVEDVFEARFLLRAVNAGREAELYPWVDVELFLDTLGRSVRRLHEAGVWHRDLSSGNVLLHWPKKGLAPGEAPLLYLVDLNRARTGRRLSVSQRTRDLSRMMIFRPEHQERFLRAYWGDDRRLDSSRRLYHLYHRSFLAKNEAKKKVRGGLHRLKSLLVPRGTHAHIPDAPEGTAARDRVVWDNLSDQPHLHAGRFEKLRIRLADADAHLAQAAAAGRSLPRAYRRYRRLSRQLYREPVPFTGAGVALRPWPEGRGGLEAIPRLLTLVEELGARHLLLRLHPWQDDHRAEEELARALAGRGFELTFSLPQNRELVRDLAAGGHRWQEAVAELAERFAPHGRYFQIGQAVNRSKWGVWSSREWLALTRAAAEILRRTPGVELLGPAVIDFEPHATLGLLNLKHAKNAGFRLDATANLLYVDRRGAPENRQLGFDTVGKVVLLRAIGETSALASPRTWITEVNWPLREGPHSPAGKSVSVDEEAQADYLVRYYLLTLGTGLVERVFWWQMVARGYGLVEPPVEPAGGSPGLRRRPSFRAFAHLLRRLDGATFLGPVGGSEGALLYRFALAAGAAGEGRELVVAWALGERGRGVLPRAAERVWGRDGDELPCPAGTDVELFTSPRYFLLDPE